MIRVSLTSKQIHQAQIGGAIELTERQALSVRGQLTAAAGAGRKPSTDRCDCGAMTRARAEKRGHQCSGQGKGPR